MSWNASCSTIPTSVASDAGVAGAGVLLSFIITAGLALSLSSSLILHSFRPPSSLKPSTIRRKLLNGYSDQQLIQGIGIQSVGLAKADSLVPYHFFIIWMLSLLSMATHNAALLALVRDFRSDWLLRWLRQILMFVNLALSCVFGVFVLEAKRTGLADTLPIACVWSEALQQNGTETTGKSVATAGGLDYIGTIVTIAGNCTIFALATWYLHNRAQKFYRVVQLVGLVLMIGIAIGATVRVLLLSQAFGTPDTPLSDLGERNWSFGQLLSMLMLVLPMISAIEILRGQVRVAVPSATEDDAKPLFEEDGVHRLQEIVAKGGNGSGSG